MILFITVLKTDRKNIFKAEHVYALYDQIKNNYSGVENVDWKFVCFTDYPYKMKCNTILLKHIFPKWWSKIEIFGLKLKENETAFYLDLDSVITGNIDNIVNYNHSFTALREVLTNRITNNLGSGMMAWSGNRTFIYKEFINNSEEYMRKHRSRGDQEFLQDVINKFKSFQSISNNIYSYKFNLPNKKELPEECQIVYFSGNPKPWDVNHEWIPDYAKFKE